MSTSTDRRVARLVGRIAEERAARGRPAISHAPRIARTFSVDIFEPPTVQGGEARLSQILEVPSDESRFSVVRRVRQTHNPTGQAKDEYFTFYSDTQPTRVGVYLAEAGMVDYANVASDRVSRPTLSEIQKPDEKQLTLVDRLFPGW